MRKRIVSFLLIFALFFGCMVLPAAADPYWAALTAYTNAVNSGDPYAIIAAA